MEEDEEIEDISSNKKDRRKKEDFDKIVEAVIGIIKKIDSTMSLRQIYYQLVGNMIENKLSEYKMLSSLLVEARKDGRINFKDMEDRGRTFHTYFSSEYFNTALEEANDMETTIRYHKYEVPVNFGQEYLHIIAVEKQALENVFESAISKWDPERQSNIILIACRGYNSLSQIKQIVDYIKSTEETKKMTDDMRIYIKKSPEKYPELIKLIESEELGWIKKIVVSYFGDYDPSGMDIEKNFKKQLEEFEIDFSEFERILLSEEDIKYYKLPAAPVKKKDSRSKSWSEEGKGGCVELDSLPPIVLKDTIIDRCDLYWNADLGNEIIELNKELNLKYRGILREKLRNLINDEIFMKDESIDIELDDKFNEDLDKVLKEE